MYVELLLNEGEEKMQYYSEILDKKFDTEEELHVEESKARKNKEESVERLKEAENSVKAAYENLEKVQEEVRKILESSNAKMNKMLEDANNTVKEAEKAYIKALQNVDTESVLVQGFKDCKKDKRLDEKVQKLIDALMTPFYF